MDNTPSNRFLRQLVHEYRGDRVGLYSAASAYYAIFSLAPIIVIISFIYTFILGETKANYIGLNTAYQFFGANGVQFYTSATEAPLSGTLGLIAILALGLFIYGISRLFSSIHSSFADIFNFAIAGESVVARTVKKHLWVVLYLSFLLLFILILALSNIMVSLFGNIITAVFLINLTGVKVVSSNFIATLLGATFCLAIIYRVVSDQKIAWRSAFIGGVAGASLFTIITTFFGLFVSHSVVIPLYGAGSFLVALVLWIYYSVQTMFLGAEVAKVYQCRYPRHRQKVCL